MPIRTALSRTARFVVALLLMAVAAPCPAAAGASAPDVAAPPDTSDTPTVQAGTNGFVVQSSGGAYSLSVGGDFQFDGRFAVGSVPSSRASTFDMRRLRPKLTATLAGRHTVNLMVNFAGGQATLQNAFVRTQLTDGLALQVGQFKMPIGLEFIQAPTNLHLAERGFPTDLVPLRDLGAVLTGRVFDGALQYHAGVANGVADGTNGFGDLDTKKDAIGRLFVEPVRGDRFGIGVGAGGTFGYRDGTPTNPQVPTFGTTGRQTVFHYRSGTNLLRPTRASGIVTRVVPQTYVHAGPVGVLGEYVRSRQEVVTDVQTDFGVIGQRVEQLQHQAWQVSATVVLTGENATFGRLVPDRPFDPSRGQWGAVSVSGRAQQIRIDDATFPTFADPATQAERVTAFGGALNWYLDANTRLTVNYVHTQAEAGDGSSLLSPEQVLLMRFQLAF